MTKEEIQALAGIEFQKIYGRKASIVYEENPITMFVKGYTASQERQAEGAWISVEDEDKLPAFGEMVLIMTGYGGFDVCYRGYYNELDTRWTWYNAMRPQHSNASVTHWQPIPHVHPIKK